MKNGHLLARVPYRGQDFLFYKELSIVRDDFSFVVLPFISFLTVTARQWYMSAVGLLAYAGKLVV